MIVAPLGSSLVIFLCGGCAVCLDFVYFAVEDFVVRV